MEAVNLPEDNTKLNPGGFKIGEKILDSTLQNLCLREKITELDFTKNKSFSLWKYIITIWKYKQHTVSS